MIGPEGLGTPGSDMSVLREQPNVHLMGHRPYDALPAYIKGFDVALIPYRLNEYTRNCFPIKFFEFLATGKPVVISPLPALREFHDAVYVARDAAELELRCAEALADPGAGLEGRLALAAQHTWSSRVAKLMGHVEARLASVNGPRS